jgi:hypothetical protein
VKFWAALVLVAACSRPAQCPAGHHLDPERTARITRALEADAQAARLLRTAGDGVAWCYAPGGAGVIAGDRLLLDDSASDRAVGARAAHLLHHRAHGVVESSGHADDPAEREARALEERLAVGP